MLAAFYSHLREQFGRGAVFFHVGFACRPEHAAGNRRRTVIQLLVSRLPTVPGAVPVIPDVADGAALHLLKAQGQSTVNRSGLDRLAGEEQARRTAGAGVVQIEHGNPRHPHFVKHPLAATGVAI